MASTWGIASIAGPIIGGWVTDIPRLCGNPDKPLAKRA
jgi:hypothetical protein